MPERYPSYQTCHRHFQEWVKASAVEEILKALACDLKEHGGVETARRLLAKQEIQTGLMRLYELELLDSSMEAYVIQDKYQPLFTDEEIQEATRRLEELGYFDGIGT